MFYILCILRFWILNKKTNLIYEGTHTLTNAEHK